VKYKVLMSIVIVALMFIPLACQHEELPELQCFPPNWTVENETEFLSLCDQCNITYFDKYEYGTRVSYCHQRYIGEAIVEGDKVSFSFDAETGELPQDNTQWREDLPDELPEIISKEEAMRIGEGTTAELCYISPNSIKFSVERIDHPCWVVGHWYGDTVKHKMSSDVVDAVTGSVIGHGGPG